MEGELKEEKVLILLLLFFHYFYYLRIMNDLSSFFCTHLTGKTGEQLEFVCNAFDVSVTGQGHSI
jgi:hypothetical protein